jgi:hypothetical protein
MVLVRFVLLSLFLTAFCSAQRTEATGSATGHVICADTNLPARMADVFLQPIVDTSILGKKPGDQPREAVTTLTETLLDGSFTIANVKPGNYYVLVEKLGYLSPLGQLSREELNHPTPDTADLIAKLLTPVTIVAGRTSTVEVRILKGAALSGTIRFDDGTPDANTEVRLLTKDKTGKWAPFRTKLLSIFSSPNTDDQGSYRISGLPAGEYLIKTTLTLSETILNQVFAEGGGSSNTSKYSLDIYSGDVFRERDAKPIKLSEGEESSSADITVPISKLHAVSGTVLVAGTGHIVNAGRIAISYTDDDSGLVSAKIDKDDSAFHFYYVPEGEYTLKVTDAHDVTREEVPYDPGTIPPSHTVEKNIRDYSPQSQPIIINGDMTGVTIQVLPKSTGSAPAKTN